MAVRMLVGMLVRVGDVSVRVGVGMGKRALVGGLINHHEPEPDAARSNVLSIGDPGG